MKRTVLVLALSGLAACEQPAATEPGPDACGSSEMAHLVGLNRSQLEGIAFTQPFRILGPGDAMTMDFRAERVNFTLDDDSKVTRIWCG